MIEIQLTQGRVALVDDIDAELARMTWCAWRGRTHRTHYAKTNLPGGKTLLLHRAVWERAHPCGTRPSDIDHVNGDGLDCRRENLRAATRSQNNTNATRRRVNTSGYVGVSESRDGNRDLRWRAYLKVAGRQIYVGRFRTAEDAARARDDAARATYGTFARFNFPNPGERRAA